MPRRTKEGVTSYCSVAFASPRRCLRIFSKADRAVCFPADISIARRHRETQPHPDDPSEAALARELGEHASDTPGSGSPHFLAVDGVLPPPKAPPSAAALALVKHPKKAKMAHRNNTVATKYESHHGFLLAQTTRSARPSPGRTRTDRMAIKTAIPRPPPAGRLSRCPERRGCEVK